MNCPGVTPRRSSIAGMLSISSVCSIITTASAPRGTTPPVAMVVAVPGFTSILGAWPQAITSALSASCFGAPSAAPAGVGGAQREAVDVGAVERRHVDRRGEIVRQHAAERGCERYAFGGQGARDRDAPRSASSPPRRRRLRGTAPAARPAGRRRAARSRRASGLASLMATASRRRGRRPDGLRCRPEPGSSPRRGPAPASTDNPARPARPGRARRRTGDDLGQAQRRGDLARKLGRERLLLDQAERAARQHAAADGEPARKRRVDPAGQQQHRPRADEAERGGLARRDADAMKLRPCRRARACARFRRCVRCRCRRWR